MFPDDLPPGGERSSGFWDLSNLLPMPRKAFDCPMCGTDRMAVKDWKFHNRKAAGSASPWRCDVRLKCTECGYVPTFGVLVPQGMYERARASLGASWIHWRTGRKAMEADGNGTPGNRR